MARSLEWLNDELQKQQTKVEDSERAMAEYREEQNALSLEDRQNIVVARLNQLNDAVTRAKTERVQKEALYNQIKALGPGVSPTTIPAVRAEPVHPEHQDPARRPAARTDTLIERYGEKYPEVIKINANIEDAKRQLASELAKAADAIRNDYQSALARSGRWPRPSKIRRAPRWI